MSLLLLFGASTGNATVNIIAPQLSGETGLTLYLHAVSDGSLTNTGGDTLTETANSRGHFSATIAEAISGDHYAVIEDSSGASVANGLLPSGESDIQSVTIEAAIVEDTGTTLPATLATLLDGDGYILTILAGAISNADNAAEAYTYTYQSTDYAVTYAGLDADGNRGTTVLSKP